MEPIRTLRILFVEDVPSDMELVARQLRMDGLAFDSMRAETEREFLDAWDSFNPDIVLSDYSLPQFDGMTALRLSLARDPDIPFILVTGSSNEEIAVQCMKAGATDYLIKGRTKRLAYAVREALDQRETRVARKKAERALRESEAKARFLAENVSDVLWMWDTESNRCTYLSPSVQRLRGYTVDEAMTHTMEQMLTPASYAEMMSQMPDRLQRFYSAPSKVHSYTDECEQTRKDGTTVWTEVLTRYIRGDRGDLRMLGIARDVSERKLAEEALHRSNERYEVATRAANDILFTRDLRTGKIFLAPRFSEIVGYQPDDVPRDREGITELMHPDDRARVAAAADACTDGTAARYEAEYRLRCADGNYRWFRARGLLERDSTGQGIRLTGSMSDIHERKLAEEQLVHDAFHDHLTNLPNRALFFDRLDSAVRRAGRDGEFNCAVLVADLDRFKNVNDSLGHPVGDQLLIKVGQRIASSIRQVDTLARLGGDEFAVLLEGPQEMASALRIADRMVKELSEPFSLDGHEIVTGASVGVAFGSGAYVNGEDILRDADIALHRAKGAGKGRYAIFDPKMHEQAIRALELEQDMRTVLGRGELLLNYQAIVTLADGRLAGFEALIRWLHPRRGMVSPMDFIPIAEETGLISPIGEWVLRESCEALLRMDRELAASGRGASTPQLTMNVNLSPRQVYQFGIVEQLGNLVQSVGIDPRRLRLEITESVLMDRPDLAREILAKFASMGFTIHLDDFGTGYSSLKYLLDFPINSIKIDRSFVSRIPADPRAMSLVQTVLLLAAKLELGVTAEGVETEEQLRTLREMGCEKAQGYFISRPLAESAAMAFLLK